MSFGSIGSAGSGRGRQMLVIHEDADEYYDSVHSTPTSTKKSLYEPEKETVLTIDKAQAIGEEYAHEQAKHLVLIGDVAANKAAPVSTQNWREKLRKQFNTQKYLHFKAPYQINRKILYFVKFKRFYTNHMPIIDPRSSFLNYWKFPILVLTILAFIEIPLVIFFDENFYFVFHSPLYVFSRTFAIIMYLIDVFVEFHVAYYDKGALVRNRYRVAFNYLTGMFLFDFIPIVTLIVVSISYNAAQFYAIELLFMLKIIPVYAIDSRFQDQLSIYPRWHSAYIIGRMVIEIMYLMHFFGCIFFGIGMYVVNHYSPGDEAEYEFTSWLNYAWTFDAVIDYGWTYRYILCTFWAFATLSTVAYGDITPMNPLEIFFAEIAMIVAVFLVAFQIWMIQQTFVDYNLEKRKYHREIIAITKFIKDKQISQETEREVRNYLEHYFKQKRNRDHYLEEEVIQKLAPQLNSQLMHEAYSRYLYSVPWIVANFSEAFIQELSQKAVEVDYSKMENIFLDGALQENDESALYFVQVGEVEIFINVPESSRPEVVLAYLKQGARFGDYAFVTNLSRKASARSRKYSQVVRFTRADFLEVIKRFPLDHQRYCYLRDEVIFNAAYNELGLQCFTCSSSDHMSMECPMTHLFVGQEAMMRARLGLMERKYQKLKDNREQERAPCNWRQAHKTRTQANKFVVRSEKQEEYEEALKDKGKYEAFFSSNRVIIESCPVDCIANFVNYYPDSNFDFLTAKKLRKLKDPQLIFPATAKLRSVSMIRKMEFSL